MGSTSESGSSERRGFWAGAGNGGLGLASRTLQPVHQTNTGQSCDEPSRHAGDELQPTWTQWQCRRCLPRACSALRTLLAVINAPSGRPHYCSCSLPLDTFRAAPSRSFGAPEAAHKNRCRSPTAAGRHGGPAWSRLALGGASRHRGGRRAANRPCIAGQQQRLQQTTVPAGAGYGTGAGRCPESGRAHSAARRTAAAAAGSAARAAACGAAAAVGAFVCEGSDRHSSA